MFGSTGGGGSAYESTATADSANKEGLVTSFGDFTVGAGASNGLQTSTLLMIGGMILAALWIWKR